jgi:hypothetical protein
MVFSISDMTMSLPEIPDFTLTQARQILYFHRSLWRDSWVTQGTAKIIDRLTAYLDWRKNGMPEE